MHCSLAGAPLPLRLLCVSVAVLLVSAACSRSAVENHDRPVSISPTVSAAPTTPLNTTAPQPSLTPQATEAPTQSSTKPAETLTIPPVTEPATPAAGTATPTAPEETAPPPVTGPLPTNKYQLSAQIDYAGHTAAVSQIVTYSNRSPDAFEELLFVVEPNRHESAFQLRELLWEDGDPVETFTLDKEQLIISLPQPLAPNEHISLSLRYDLALPDLPGPFGYSERQTNLGDWYPMIPPYQPGQGWLVHEPAAVGEHLVYDVADFEVKLKLSGYPDDLVVAASAPAVPDGEWQSYTLRSARNFALSISPDYHVASQPVDTILITSYYLPENRLAALAALQATVDAVQVYGRKFSTYPHGTLAVVQAGFDDGMEYDGLYFLDQELYENYNGTVEGYLTAIAAHETAHQWWYGIVANDQALEPWLDEALATYSELLFYEEKHPQSVGWWWDIRVLRFEPTGNVGGTIYDHDDFRSYVDTVYLNGALFMDEIRLSLGDTAFQQFLQEYLSTHDKEIATAEDFWLSMAEYKMEQMVPLKENYFDPR